MKRFCAFFALLLVIIMTFSGCAGVIVDTDSLLSPPRPEGELYKISEVLEKSTNEKFILKYPLSGEYRSAFVLKDINRDGTDEAFVFYSTTNESIVNMHITLIKKQNGEWVFGGDFKCAASGVETVEFHDMNNDGVEEILVGWSVYGTVDKSIGVYALSGGMFVQRATEKYTKFLCGDINGDGEKELFLTHLDTVNKRSFAKIIKISSIGIAELGYCELDGLITEYKNPVIGKTADGESAVYIDAVKTQGAITEVVVLGSDGVRNGRVIDPENMVYTGREQNVAIMDIDGDGVYEIPSLTVITLGSGTADHVYRTDWYALGRSGIVPKVSAIMNYNDGYYITIPEKWMDKITVTRDTANRARTISVIDSETGMSGSPLVTVSVIPRSENTTPQPALNQVEITRTETMIYVATIGNYEGAEAVTIEEFKTLFHLLGGKN